MHCVSAQLRRIGRFVLTALFISAPLFAAENDYLNLILPSVGDHTLHILSPTLLELKRLNGKPPAPAPIDSWDFVDADGVFHPPALTEIVVKVNGTTATVNRVGFKRRPFYAPLLERDLRVD